MQENKSFKSVGFSVFCTSISLHHFHKIQ